MRTLILSLSALLCSGFLSSAMAFSMGPPEDKEIKSPNGKYVLKVATESGLHQICEGDKVLWKFKRQVWHDDYFLSDDGKYVLWLAWSLVQDWKVQKNPALIVYSADGPVMTKTYGEISKPQAQQGPGPIGDHWREWRWLKSDRVGEKVTVPVYGKDAVVIDFTKLPAKP